MIRPEGACWHEIDRRPHPLSGNPRVGGE